MLRWTSEALVRVLAYHIDRNTHHWAPHIVCIAVIITYSLYLIYFSILQLALARCSLYWITLG